MCLFLFCLICSLILFFGFLVLLFFYTSTLFFFFKFVYFSFWLRWVFAAARGLFFTCGERGLLFVAVRRPLVGWPLLLWRTGSRHAGFSSCGSWAPERRLSSCGARAQLFRGVWDPPRPGLEPMSPAWAGGFLSTAPPGKPLYQHS